MNLPPRVIVLLLATFAPCAAAQTALSDAARDTGRVSLSAPTLRDTIASADSSLFDAFNRGNLTRLMSFFTRDLEFYHDTEGLENYAQTRADFAQLFARPAPIHRELVPGSLEVFPIKNYGAMEVGRHRFCHIEGGKQDCGEFRFVHIWRRTLRGWQISRVVSYGH